MRALICSTVLLLHVWLARPYRLYGQRRYLQPTEINCYDLPMKTTAITPVRIISEGFRMPRMRLISSSLLPEVAPPTDASLNAHSIQKRFDHLFHDGEDLIKEHAKLVQDINSLRQVVFVAPLLEENRDYEDSIYHEIIETTTTTTTAKPKPSTTMSLVSTTARPRTKSTGIPILLLGGASHKQTVRATPSLKLPLPTISLVGSSISPLAKHPYPFVGQSTSLRPFKICMPPTPALVPPTKRPSLWNRLLSFIPSLAG